MNECRISKKPLFWWIIELYFVCYILFMHFSEIYGVVIHVCVGVWKWSSCDQMDGDWTPHWLNELALEWVGPVLCSGHLEVKWPFNFQFTLHAHTLGRRWFGECLVSVLLRGRSEADQPQWLKIHKWKGQTSQLTMRIWVPNNHIVAFEPRDFASSKSKNCLMWLFSFKNLGCACN